MLRVKQNEDEIVVREFPVLKWINALVAAVTVFFIVLIAISSAAGGGLFWFFCLLAPLVAFVLYLLTYPTTTTKVNNRGRIVSIRKQSLLGYSFDVYSFNEINDPIYVDVRNGSHGVKVYRLKMPLKDGREIELSTVDGSRESQYFDAAHLMNPYIFETSKQIPSKPTGFDDD
jgi:hypothetical protein